MSKQFAARDLVPMLENLVRAGAGRLEAAYFAKPGALGAGSSGTRRFAPRASPETCLVRGERDRAWAVLGLAHTLLGNYRVAARSYRRALALAPDCGGVYEHNLGHVLMSRSIGPKMRTGAPWKALTARCPKRARSPVPMRMPCSVAASWTKRGRCCVWR